MIELNKKEIDCIAGGILGYKINTKMLPIAIATTVGAYTTSFIIRKYIEPICSPTVTFLSNLASNLFYFAVGGSITEDKPKVA